ncbi:MAG: sugar-binding transcriptional regulator [Verrucomicrobiota bacterium]
MTKKKDAVDRSPLANGFREDDASPWPEQLAVRIAWCYYNLGMTQQEVASRLKMNRIRVNRLLNEARRRGIVRVSIESKLAQNIELEEGLKERFKLERAEVLLTLTQEPARLAELLGVGACPLVGRLLKDGMTVGVGWGMTLRHMADSFPEEFLHNVEVVALIGSLTRRSSISPHEAATSLAAHIHAECFYLPGPVLCDSRQSRDTLMAQPMIQEAMERGRAADLALVSVGGPLNETLARTGVIDRSEVIDVRRHGAVGNFLGYYIDDEAEPIDHPVNKRVIGLLPHELLSVPDRLMISGGPEKVRVLHALLRRGLLTGIVTDQETARALLAFNLKAARGNAA